jgi:arsenite oxidase small subunit
MTIFSKLNRRDFLKMSGTGVAGFIAGQALHLSPVLAAGFKKQVYPLVDIGPLSGLEVGAAVEFRYPDEDSPAVMVHLAESAKQGIGPKNAIVAYSTLCTHKGCPVKFHPERRMLICPCHWSTFDVAKAGGVVIGQASQPLPQIKLRLEGDRVQAYGVDGLIYGRHTNIL